MSKYTVFDRMTQLISVASDPKAQQHIKTSDDESVETIDWIPCVGQIVVDGKGEKFTIEGFLYSYKGYVTAELHNLETGKVSVGLEELKPYVVRVNK